MTNTTHEICVLLGSNILPEKHIPEAIARLGQRLEITRISSIWESKAVGSSGSNFLNAAVLIYSQRHPGRLKIDILRPLEAEMGRIRTSDKNAPRPIDLDVVAFDGRPTDPGLWKYAHAAVPVAELLPSMAKPGSGASLQDAARQLSENIRLWRRSDLNLPALFNQRTSEPTLLASTMSPYLT